VNKRMNIKCDCGKLKEIYILKDQTDVCEEDRDNMKWVKIFCEKCGDDGQSHLIDINNQFFSKFLSKNGCSVQESIREYSCS